MSFDLGQRSKKVKSVSRNTTSSISQDSILDYLFEIKQKIDYLYHICSVVKQKKEIIREEQEDSDEEEYKGGNYEGRTFYSAMPQTIPNSVINFAPNFKRKEEIQLQFDSSEMTSRNKVVTSTSQINQSGYPLLITKKHLVKQKPQENETKSKNSRNVNFSSQNLNTLVNNTLSIASTANPFMNNTFGSQPEIINIQRPDGGDVNMFG